MKIDFQKVILNPVSDDWGLKKREVLRVVTENQGYGEIVSWPELGDPTLDEHLESWKNGSPTYSMEKALEYSRLDFEARQKGHTLWENCPKLPLALFLGSVSKSQEILKYFEKKIPDFSLNDWSHLKVKMKSLNEYESLLSLLDLIKNKPLKLRVDFNFSLTEEEFLSILKRFKSDSFESLDYLEDPFTYHWGVWEKISNQFPVRLALDRASLTEKTRLDDRRAQGTAPFLYVVGKPLIEDCEMLADSASMNMRRIVMTSCMGSTLESLQALWEAQKIYQNQSLVMDPVGMTTHFLWEPIHSEDPFQGFSKGFFEPAKLKGPGWGILP